MRIRTAVLALVLAASMPFAASAQNTQVVSTPGTSVFNFNQKMPSVSTGIMGQGVQSVQVVSSGGSGIGSCASLTSAGLSGLSSCLIGFLDSITVLLMAAAVVYIIYGAFEMIRSEEKRESGRQTVIYGIIGLFAMISIWGFVNILDSTFKLRQNYIPAPQFHQ